MKTLETLLLAPLNDPNVERTTENHFPRSDFDTSFRHVSIVSDSR